MHSTLLCETSSYFEIKVSSGKIIIVHISHSKWNISGATYNIPICIWLMDTHPYNPPMVFVKPTATMQIKQGRNVDSNGKIDLPYLREWRFVRNVVFLFPCN